MVLSAHSCRFIFSFVALSITFRMIRDVRMVEDRSFEGVQFSRDRGAAAREPCICPPRYIQQGQRQGDLHFHHGKGLQGGIMPALPRRGKHLEFRRRSRAIKHSSIAQLLLPRTWSERGIANLLESEISESFACCEIKGSLIGIPVSFKVYH